MVKLKQQAQQAFQNQQQIANMYSGLGTQQMGLSNFERAGMGQDIGALGQLGAIRQGLRLKQIKQPINKQHKQQLTNRMED